jgi:superfamily II DNA or RNA helicase
VKRRFSKRQRKILSLVAGGKCQLCRRVLSNNFHADHIRPFSKGGRTITLNGQALCPNCNLAKGNEYMAIKLRNWQHDAIRKSLKWLLEDRSDRHFVLNAAPGAGKTIAACEIARELFLRNEIDRVIVIAPRAEVINQWADDFFLVTGRFMSKVTAADGDIKSMGVDVCATWSAVQGLQDAFQAVCRSGRVLVICDEHHHAAIKAAWGDSADSSFKDGKFVLILTGTPIRSDGAQTAWLPYDDAGAIDHPEEGTFSLTYGEAVDLGYCRPITFHRHGGKYTLELDNGESIEVSQNKPAELTGNNKRIPGLQSALDFYRLACSPKYEADNTTPLADGYQATMLEWGSKKLDDLRCRMPEAGGLVIAPDIDMAIYMAKLLEMIEGEAPTIVHSKLSNPEARIKAFRNTDKRWIVSVAMISEGVDIKRLRVLVHLPKATTELAFRQAMGRVVRTAGPEDDTRSYVIMPSIKLFEEYARKVELEMSPTVRFGDPKPKYKKCPVCRTECELSEKICDCCGYEFPTTGGPSFIPCSSCGALNPRGATECHACGKSLGVSFNITLNDALRTGAIIRGMDIEETDVQEGERIAKPIREKVLKSGDDVLIRIIRVLPDESYARLQSILSTEK